MHVSGPAGACAHEHGDVVTLDQQHLGVGRTDVALGERRALGQLAGRGEVAARHRDVRAGLDHEQRQPVVADHPSVGDAGRDQHVVAGADGQPAEHALQGAGAGLHVDQLVADGVTVQRARVGGGHERQADVVVADERDASGDRVAAVRRERARAEVVGRDRLVRHERSVGHLDRLDAGDRTRRMPVVQQARRPGEALLAEQLLHHHRTVDTVQRVALARHVADAAVVHDPSLSLPRGLRPRTPSPGRSLALAGPG